MIRRGRSGNAAAHIPAGPVPDEHAHPVPSVAPAPIGSAALVSALHQAASVLLRYPDDDVFAALPLMGRVAAALPAEAGAALGRFVAHAAAADPDELAEHYVASIDLRRRAGPYLTYYRHGDTRRRGEALRRFLLAYREAGWTPGPDELPDHLCVVLEFAAAEPAAGGALLAEHRVGIELLHRALADAGSPYADVVAAVLVTVPVVPTPPGGSAEEIAATGPPVETVGLSGAAPVFVGVDQLRVRR